MEKASRIYVAGHTGMVGSAIKEELISQEYHNLLLTCREELDLREQESVREWFKKNHPDYVFLAAARVGGIAANMERPAQFLYDNLMIQSNVIHQSWRHGVKKLLFLGSSCIYPRESPQPMKEEYLLTGPPEPTNEGYAIAKIAGLKMCEYYMRQYGFDSLTIIPPNLYGPRDNFSPEESHVIAALIRRFHQAKIGNREQVTIWGTGKARREFMFVEDLASAAIYLMNEYHDRPYINVGTGEDVSILQLANLIREVVGFEGEIVKDRSKPDGMPRKLMDISRFEFLEWKQSRSLQDGLQATYSWFLSNIVG